MEKKCTCGLEWRCGRIDSHLKLETLDSWCFVAQHLKPIGKKARFTQFDIIIPIKAGYLYVVNKMLVDKYGFTTMVAGELTNLTVRIFLARHLVGCEKKIY